MNYARSTTVTEAESRAEIEALLKGRGCRWVEVGLNARGDAVVKFSLALRNVRLLVPMPAPRERLPRWRVLLLVLKAKLEAVDSSISTFDDEFLAHIALEDGQTAGRFMASRLPQLTGRTA